MDRIFLFLVVGAVFLVQHPLLATADLGCPLAWEPHGFGHFTSTSNPIRLYDGGPILARINLDGVWTVGIVDPTRGKIFTVIQATSGSVQDSLLQIRSYTFYQVLTNPNNCNVRWVGTQSRERTPPFAYDAGTQEFVGRAVVQSYTLGGRVRNQELLIEREGQIYKPPFFEVLVSIYPKVQAVIRELRYTALDFEAVRAAMVTELVRAELILNTINDVQLTTTVTHSKTVSERFVLEEETVHFQQIGQLSLRDVRLWFGGDDLQLNSHQIDGAMRVTVNRTRDLQLSRTVTVSGRSDVQICSTMDVLDGFPLDFEAETEFMLPGMTSEHVEYVLTTVGGRPVLRVENGYVLATMRGRLSGRYVTSTSMINAAPEKLGPCVSFL